MSILTLDDVFVAMNNSKEIAFNKGSITTTTNLYYSAWKNAVGYPLFGATPTSAAVCSDATTGAFPLPTRTGTQNRILLGLDIMNTVTGYCFMLEDRLIHMGGMSGVVLTAQTAGVDASVTTSNMVARIGASDYSELGWWLEWYANTGGGVNATCAVTYDDNSTGNIVVAIPAGTTITGRRIQIVPTNGRWIKSIQSVTLSATTGTAGNFGVTVTRNRARVTIQAANKFEVVTWDALRAVEIEDNSCLTFNVFTTSTTMGDFRGALFMGVG